MGEDKTPEKLLGKYVIEVIMIFTTHPDRVLTPYSDAVLQLKSI
jgi:hypothetical protein